MVDERVHVAAGDAPPELGNSQLEERLGVSPVGLGQNTDAKALMLEDSADDRRAEAHVVHVGVAGDQHHVALGPAEEPHFLFGRRKERGHAEALCPELLAVEERWRGRLRRRHDG